MTPESNSKPRRRGRPCKEPPWLKEVAEKVGRGIPLRRALWSLNRYTFTESEMKNLYRLKKFREYYETAKIAYYREWGRMPGRHHTGYGERMLALLNAPGISEHLRRQ
jgi:hypothetical protein